MNWFLLTLLCAFFWGTGQVFIKKGMSSLSSLWNVIFAGISYLLIYVPFALVHGISFTVTPTQFILLIFIAFLYIFFYYAIEKGEISLTGTIIASYPIIVVILSHIFLKEPISNVQYLAIGIILSGGMLLSTPSKKEKKQRFKFTWLLWAIFGAITTGLGDFLAKVSMGTVPIYTYLFYFSIAYICAAGIFAISDKIGRRFPTRIRFTDLLTSIFGIGMLALGFLFFNMALSRGQASLVAPISSSYVAVTVLFAYFFLQERINRWQLLGIFGILLGIIAIGF